MVAHKPLHGSGRADFPHPALTLGNDAQTAEGIVMVDANGREPAVDQESIRNPGVTQLSLGVGTASTIDRTLFPIRH
jgi:hypothetical protein